MVAKLYTTFDLTFDWDGDKLLVYTNLRDCWLPFFIYMQSNITSHFAK